MEKNKQNAILASQPKYTVQGEKKSPQARLQKEEEAEFCNTCI